MPKRDQLAVRVTHPDPCDQCGSVPLAVDCLAARDGVIYEDTRYYSCSVCERNWRETTSLAWTDGLGH